MSEYGWVIEGAWSHVQTPDYWVGSSAWRPDHNRALRFVRKQDAEQAASMMLDGLRVRICEHAWACAPEYQQGRAQSAREPQYQDRPTAADSAVGKTNDELEAIRARDADDYAAADVLRNIRSAGNTDPELEATIIMVADRRALLAAYDALAAAARKVVWFDFCDDDDDVQEAVADLRALLGGE